MAGAETVDEGGHEEVGFHACCDAGADDGEVGGALEDGVSGVARSLVGVEVGVGVGEGAGFMVGVCDGLIAEVGGAVCLLFFGGPGISGGVFLWDDWEGKVRR